MYGSWSNNSQVANSNLAVGSATEDDIISPPRTPRSSSVERRSILRFAFMELIWNVGR